ncbi:MAG: flotillin domain-containing protein, partial [Planctomycetota bacterium]
VQVSAQVAESNIGQKQAERDQRIRTAALEAEGISGEANAQREQEIAIAEQNALAIQGKKQAEADQRIKVAELEATSIEGENKSKAEMAAYEATLAEARAEARRRGDVALANASRDVLTAEKEEELARMEKEVIAKEMIERQQVEINAEAEAERVRRVAKGEADAVLAKYNAEAEGLKKVLDAKAEGYHNLIEACASRPDLAPSLLIIEKLPELVAEQVKAIQNLKIDKITVWDSGAPGNGDGTSGGTGSTGNFLKGLIGSLPPIHELADQAGIDLPEVLGKVQAESDKPAAIEKPSVTPSAPPKAD